MIYKAIFKNDGFEYTELDTTIPDSQQVVIIYQSGEEEFYRGNAMRFHREDGPAVVRNMPPQTFYENGLQIDIGGFDEWWIDGEEITDAVERAMKAGKIKSDWKNWTTSDKAKFKLMFC